MMKKLAVLTLAAALGPASLALAADSGWTTLPIAAAAQAPQAEAADAGMAGVFNRDSVAALFDSPAATLPSADDLVGIWLQVAKADDAGAVYNGEGLPPRGKEKLVFISAKGNPFSSNGIRLLAYVDAMRRSAKPVALSFDERSAKFAGSECRKLDGTHMLCRVTEAGRTRFEGYFQTKKGQEN